MAKKPLPKKSTPPAKAIAKPVLANKAKKIVAPPVKSTAAKASLPKPAKGVPAKAAPVKNAVKLAPQKDVKLSGPGKKGAEKAQMSKANAAKATLPGKAGAVELKVKAGTAESRKTSAPVSGKASTAVAGKAPGKMASGKAAGRAAKAAVAQSKPYDSDLCREVACETLATSGGYCRLHYIKNWKKIKRKELILKEKKLNQYIEELVAKYPDKYIEAIKQDLSDEKSFSKVIYDLELDESIDDIDVGEDSDEEIIENIKRDFEDGDTDF